MQITPHSTYLITGGSSGLGAATVRRLAGQGARVLIADVDDAAGEQLADELAPVVRYVHTDVTDAAQVEAAVARATDSPAEAPLRGVVNCAGIAPAAKLIGKEGPHALELFSKVIAVNLVGTFNVMRLAAAAMAQAQPGDDGERGVIINTASVAAFEGQAGQSAYAGSKGGVAAMTLPAARELARYGIRVVAIAPGLFDTPMMAAFPDNVREALAAQAVYPQRFGQADEFAALVQHVIENPMLNGCVIRLDGAVRMPPR